MNNKSIHVTQKKFLLLAFIFFISSIPFFFATAKAGVTRDFFEAKYIYNTAKASGELTTDICIKYFRAAGKALQFGTLYNVYLYLIFIKHTSSENIDLKELKKVLMDTLLEFHPETFLVENLRNYVFYLDHRSPKPYAFNRLTGLTLWLTPKFLSYLPQGNEETGILGIIHAFFQQMDPVVTRFDTYDLFQNFVLPEEEEEAEQQEFLPPLTDDDIYPPIDDAGVLEYLMASFADFLVDCFYPSF